MANLFQTITSGLAELKNYYQGPIVSQFNDDLPILRGAERVKKGWSGLQVVRPLKVRRNQGIGATSDGGTLPAIGRQTTVQALIPAAFNYLRFGVTGPMIKASKSDVGSFVRSAAYELEQGYLDLKSDVNRQLSWDGTGTLAKVNTGVSGSTSLVIKGREAVEAALQFIDVGMVIDIVSGATTVVASGISVDAITAGTPSSATATITLSAAVTCSADDRLVRANSEGNEIKGLLYELDGATTTVFNVDRSTYISFQGNVTDLSGAQLTLDALQAEYDQALRRGDGKLSAIYSDFPSRRMYQKLLTADKRFSNTVKGDGGFSNKEENYLEFNGIPWVADKDCPQRIFMLPPEVITMYILAELEFADETGSMYIAQTSADEFEVRIRYFANLFNEKPSATAVMKNYISP
jgi:hypothetical protein